MSGSVRARWWPWLLLAAAIFVADQWTKQWILDHYQHGDATVVTSFFNIVRAHNPGAAFSFAQGATVLFTAVAVTVVVVILRTARKLRSTPWACSLGLLLGGALGNLVDRLFRSPGVGRGAVVYFIDFRVWPVFNIADSAIVVGGLLAVLLSFRGYELDGTRKTDERPAE